MHVLRAGPPTTTWFPEHGMVGASLTHEGEELLSQRGGIDAYLAKGIVSPWATGGRGSGRHRAPWVVPG